MTIREASVQDAPEFLRIYSYYVENTAITFEYAAPSLREFQGRIAETLKEYPWLAAEQGGRVCGYAYAGPFNRREAYRHDAEVSIYLEKEMRRRGMGRQLYGRLEEILKRQNILNLYACIGVPMEEGDPYLDLSSVRFHEKEGYAKAGEFPRCGYKFSRWYGMVWMEKRIGIQERPADFIPYPRLAEGEPAAGE